MKNTNRKVVDHVFKNTLKCAADKNKETKAAPKLRRQARWVYNPRKNSKWVENGLTAAKLRRSWAFWAIVMEKTIRHTWQLQLELLHFQFRDRMARFFWVWLMTRHAWEIIAMQNLIYTLQAKKVESRWKGWFSYQNKAVRRKRGSRGAEAPLNSVILFWFELLGRQSLRKPEAPKGP